MKYDAQTHDRANEAWEAALSRCHTIVQNYASGGTKTVNLEQVQAILLNGFPHSYLVEPVVSQMYVTELKKYADALEGALVTEDALVSALTIAVLINVTGRVGSHVPARLVDISKRDSLYLLNRFSKGT